MFVTREILYAHSVYLCLFSRALVSEHRYLKFREENNISETETISVCEVLTLWGRTEVVSHYAIDKE